MSQQRFVVDETVFTRLRHVVPVGGFDLTRHFVWRQAKTSLIDADTQRVVLVAEVLPTLDAHIVDLVAVDFTNGLKHFAVDPVVRIIDAATPSLALPG